MRSALAPALLRFVLASESSFVSFVWSHELCLSGITMYLIIGNALPSKNKGPGSRDWEKGRKGSSQRSPFPQSISQGSTRNFERLQTWGQGWKAAGGAGPWKSRERQLLLARHLRVLPSVLVPRECRHTVAVSVWGRLFIAGLWRMIFNVLIKMWFIWHKVVDENSPHYILHTIFVLVLKHRKN